MDCLTPWSLFWNLFHAHGCGELYNATGFDGGYTFAEYLPYFLKTLLLELPVYYLILRHQKSWKSVLGLNLAVNLATHPIVFFVIPLLIAKWGGTYLHYLVTAEIFAPAVEALLLVYVYKINLRYAVTAAVCANLFSWSVGVFWL